MTLTAGAGLAVCSMSLLSGERPVLTAGGAAALAVVGAVLTGWRWLASTACFAAASSVLFAAAVSSDRVSTWHLVAASALLVGLVVGLDRVERPGVAPAADVIGRAPAHRRLLAPVLGLAGTVAVALTSARPAVPSIGLLLLGLAAGVAALVLATSTS